MNQLETGEAPEAVLGNSDLQKELARSFGNGRPYRQYCAPLLVRHTTCSPYLTPSSIAGDGSPELIRVEEAGFRLVAEVSPDVLEEVPPPVVHGSFHDRLIASKSPFQISDVAAHELYRAGDALAEALIKRGQRTLLLVPMLRNDEIIGSLSFGRQRVEPFTEKEIELVTDFAAQATIALEITCRERQLREVQMQLAHTNRVVTLGELGASITHEVNQPIAVLRV